MTTPDGAATDWKAQLQQAAQTGEPLMIGSFESRSDDHGQTLTTHWGLTAQLPAELIRAMLTNDDVRVDPRGLTIDGAWIQGELDLRYIDFQYPLGLTNCRLDYDLDLTGSTLKGLNLSGSSLKGLIVDNGTIDGVLDLNGTTVSNASGAAIYLDGATITGGVNAADGFNSKGEVRAVGGTISGGITLNGATLVNPNQIALNLDGASIAGGINAADGFNSEGEVRAVGGTIDGGITLNGATLVNPNQIALNLDGASITGDIYLRNDFRASGEFRASGAAIHGQLVIGGTLDNGSNAALTLDQATVDGGVFTPEGLTTHGEVSALDATLNVLDLSGASLHNRGGTALHLDRLHVPRGLFLRQKFVAYGEVRVPSVHTAHLDLDDATLSNPSGNALLLDGATVTSGLMARKLCAHGMVSAVNCVLGRVELDETALVSAPEKIALSAESSTVTTLVLKPATVVGTIDLTRTSIGDLRTPKDGVPEGQLKASGWQLGDIHGYIRTNHKAAACWLNSLPPGSEFTAQPWHAVATVYDRNGQPADARRLRLKTSTLVTRNSPLHSRMIRPLYYAIAGHGYYPLWAAAWLVLAVGAAAVIVGMNRVDFIPTDMVAARNAATTYAESSPGTSPTSPITAESDCSTYPDYPCLNARTYSLGSVFPAAINNPRPDWAPKPDASLIVTYGLPFLRIMSWFFTAILVAGVTGLLRKS